MSKQGVLSLRVHPARSIAAKLFFAVTTLVMMSVGALAWKNSEAFKEQLSRQFQRVAVDTSENVGQATEATFANWETQLKLLLQNVVNENPENMGPFLERFVANDESIVAIHLVKYNGTPNLEDLSFRFTTRENVNFEDSAPNELKATIQKTNLSWIQEILAKESDDNVDVKNNFKETKLPLLSMARSFRVKDSPVRYWAVLTTWQSPIMGLLKTSKDISTIIVDANGKIFSSKNPKELGSDHSVANLEVFKMATKGVVRTGFKGSYLDENGKEWLGAYNRLARLGLTVLVQQSAESAYAAIRVLVAQTLKWGAFFVLLAIFFSYFGSTGMTKNLRALTMVTQKIAQGDFGNFVKPRSRDEVGVLSASINMMSRQIQDLLQQQVQKARFEKELETAHAVQDTLFPKKDRKRRGVLQISGFSAPATECGGDWWGHCMSDDGVEYIFIADAMGHGVPAALVTAMAYSSCMTIISMIQHLNRSERSPKAILERFNKVLFDAVEGSISMTFFALVIDTKTGTVTYANAGHNFPILIPADPEDKRGGKKNKALQKISPLNPISLKANGSILGVDPAAQFEEHTMQLRGGDKFVLFTDGLIENTSKKGEAWGRKVFIEKVLQNIDGEAEAIKEKLVKEAKTHFEGQPYNDDVTLVVVEYPKSAVGTLSLDDDDFTPAAIPPPPPKIPA